MESQERYQHTQTGYWILIFMVPVVLPCIVLGIVLDAPAGERAGLFAVAALLAAACYLFGSLTTVVREGQVEVRFGPGLVRKRFSLADFTSITAVRTKWYYGWGIRLIPRGWLYNVSGLDAVELVRRNGRRIRIGTDDPQALVAVLREALAALPAASGTTISPEKKP